MQLDFPLFRRAAPKGDGPRAPGLTSPLDDQLGRCWTEARLLRHLRARGARRLGRVVFRPNRSTIWSLTRSGTSLNLQEGFRSAPIDVVDAFAVIARQWRSPTDAYRQATRKVRGWPGLVDAMKDRSEAPGTGGAASNGGRVAAAACVGTDIQRHLLRSAFAHFNRTRLDGLLPEDVLLRFSARMTQRLGQMQGLGQLEGVGRTMGTAPQGTNLGLGAHGSMEIALSIDLLIEGNEGEFIETLLHEMAHAADYAQRGTTDHGPHWKAWAQRIGCAPHACTTVPIRRRSRNGTVSGVPPGLRGFLEPGDPTVGGASGEPSGEPARH